MAQGHKIGCINIIYVLPIRKNENQGLSSFPPRKCFVELFHLAVADPGFSRGGAPIPKLGLFCKFFAENWMKMKEFGSGTRGARPWRPP